MLLRIQPSASTPIFRQLADSVRADVATGRIVPGERLPAARQVAAALEVNVHTVLRAYQELRDEGLVELRRGRGAVITEAAAQLPSLAAEIRALAAKASALKLSPETLSALVLEAAREAY
ncbi:putative GntR family transcriptional regulator [Gordonia hirsuta DSM 44140 = NBRC 16056]|uniref:Putative GntR family transcriptional regulator n=1 Tax=Gordonia hirsuta DSM 44140 = NBRC 16056 TaxID=1121927 RepID=L7L7Y3_9ACTN|nr:GntR family transcriptional regulator [Gordonia hirsuta]GAC56133.1 putative GntR family transcriptional regulator [Gordonia hirsuta DSM 44140 = NBRC 16056]